jgi:NAD(P)-dependent dehydrogenase (short-subunit alcohol dehydrogenase family)
MKLNLEGRTALITGGSRGIGLGVARLLAEEGCALHLSSRSAESLEQAAAALRKEHGAQVTVHPYDLSDTANCVALARAAGTLDILVNNAGAIPGGDIASVDDATWRKAWDLKVFGFINLTREVFPAMCARGKGVIVNVIGGAGERPRPGYIVGSMANAGLMAMSRALGVEGMNHGVRVVGVNPGGTETDRQIVRWKQLAKEKFGDENRWRELTTHNPYGRLGTVDEVASMVVFVCSDRSGYTNGTVITVDGGAAAAG